VSDGVGVASTDPAVEKPVEASQVDGGEKKKKKSGPCGLPSGCNIL
jgi:hypothetical protein